MYHKLSASTKGLALLKSLGRNHRNNKQNCIMIEPSRLIIKLIFVLKAFRYSFYVAFVWIAQNYAIAHESEKISCVEVDEDLQVL